MLQALALLALTADAPARTTLSTEFHLTCADVEYLEDGIWRSLAELLGGEFSFEATGTRAASWTDRWTHDEDEPALLTRTFDALEHRYSVSIGAGGIEEDEELILGSPLVDHGITCTPFEEDLDLHLLGRDAPKDEWLEGLEVNPAPIDWIEREAPGSDHWYGDGADARHLLRPVGRPALEMGLGSSEYAELILLLAWAADPVEHLSFEDARLVGEAQVEDLVPLELELTEQVDLLPGLRRVMKRLDLDEPGFEEDELRLDVVWSGEGELERVEVEGAPAWRLELTAELEIEVHLLFGDDDHVRCKLQGELVHTQTWQ